MIAPMYSFRQFFGNKSFPASAQLTRILGINEHDMTTRFYRFVRGVCDELMPRRIDNAFGQMMILHHALHVQVLNRDEAIAIDDLARDFVCIILALVRDVLMRLR